jgi:hypothetical protein
MKKPTYSSISAGNLTSKPQRRALLGCAALMPATALLEACGGGGDAGGTPSWPSISKAPGDTPPIAIQKAQQIVVSGSPEQRAKALREKWNIPAPDLVNVQNMLAENEKDPAGRPLTLGEKSYTEIKELYAADPYRKMAAPDTRDFSMARAPSEMRPFLAEILRKDFVAARFAVEYARYGLVDDTSNSAMANSRNPYPIYPADIKYLTNGGTGEPNSAWNFVCKAYAEAAQDESIFGDWVNTMLIRGDKSKINEAKRILGIAMKSDDYAKYLNEATANSEVRDIVNAQYREDTMSLKILNPQEFGVIMTTQVFAQHAIALKSTLQTSLEGMDAVKYEKYINGFDYFAAIVYAGMSRKGAKSIQSTVAAMNAVVNYSKAAERADKLLIAEKFRSLFEKKESISTADIAAGLEK